MSRRHKGSLLAERPAKVGARSGEVSLAARKDDFVSKEMCRIFDNMHGGAPVHVV